MALDKHILRVSIVNPSNRRSTEDSVLLEQEPWDPFVGYLTKMGVIGYLNKLLFDKGDPQPYCAAEGSRFGKSIYAYPSRQDLNYKVGITHGLIGERRAQELNYSEVIECNLQEELTLRYPAVSITRFAWVSEAYSPEGDTVIKPTVTIIPTGVKLSEKVYGTLLITYKVFRHIYGVTIHPRNSIENKLQSYVFAIWDGGNTYIEVTAPDGAEEGECNNNKYVDFNAEGPDPMQPKSVEPEDWFLDIDYCTQLPVVYQ